MEIKIFACDSVSDKKNYRLTAVMNPLRSIFYSHRMENIPKTIQPMIE